MVSGIKPCLEDICGPNVLMTDSTTKSAFRKHGLAYENVGTFSRRCFAEPKVLECLFGNCAKQKMWSNPLDDTQTQVVSGSEKPKAGSWSVSRIAMIARDQDFFHEAIESRFFRIHFARSSPKRYLSRMDHMHAQGWTNSTERKAALKQKHLLALPN